MNCFVTGNVETKSVADRISEDDVAKPQEKSESGVKQKGRESENLPWKI